MWAQPVSHIQASGRYLIERGFVAAHCVGISVFIHYYVHVGGVVSVYVWVGNILNRFWWGNLLRVSGMR